LFGKLEVVTTQHNPLCDGNHTARQACNELLADANDAVALVTQAHESTPDEPVIVEPPPAVPEVYRAEPPALPTMITSEEGVEPQIEDEAEAARPLVATVEMPAPSPWAVRAWEDTAAAVGATATAAPPAAERDNAAFHPNPGRGHVVRAAAVFAAAVAGLLFLWRRR
jgi:hypothetical protein